MSIPSKQPTTQLTAENLSLLGEGTSVTDRSSASDGGSTVKTLRKESKSEHGTNEMTSAVSSTTTIIDRGDFASSVVRSFGKHIQNRAKKGLKSFSSFSSEVQKRHAERVARTLAEEALKRSAFDNSLDAQQFASSIQDANLVDDDLIQRMVGQALSTEAGSEAQQSSQSASADSCRAVTDLSVSDDTPAVNTCTSPTEAEDSEEPARGLIRPLGSRWVKRTEEREARKGRTSGC
ncbi:hypothetical protein IAU59_002045 [Kwoniella sp. CBS 9459]